LAVRAGISCTWIEASFFRQRARSVPICAEWKRTCPAWTSYATTRPSAFGWRRRPARRDKNPFSSKWPNDGSRSPSTPRRRKQARHFVTIASHQRLPRMTHSPRHPEVLAHAGKFTQPAQARLRGEPRRATARMSPHRELAATAGAVHPPISGLPEIGILVRKSVIADLRWPAKTRAPQDDGLRFAFAETSR
jgi:hypothetical protein